MIIVGFVVSSALLLIAPMSAAAALRDVAAAAIRRRPLVTVRVGVIVCLLYIVSLCEWRVAQSGALA